MRYSKKNVAVSRAHMLTGTDEDGLPPCFEDFSGVEVPEVGFSLQSEQYTNLLQLVDPLKESNNYGIDVYEETLHFLTNV